MTYKEEFIYPQEYEQAANSYLMSVVAIIAGLPLPIINLIASVGYYMAHRKSSYFVRWHCIQAVLAQAIMIPFNSIAFGWTLAIFLERKEVTLAYGTYMFLIVFFNVFEFFAVIYTSLKVKKGIDVRWPVIAGITDSLCSTENRDKYKI